LAAMPEKNLKKTESEIETEIIRQKIRECAQIRCDQMKNQVKFNGIKLLKIFSFKKEILLFLIYMTE